MSDVLYEVSDGIATITLNRPQQRNALSLQAAARLSALWQDIDARPDVRVAILTSTPCGVFCAGMDLKDAARVRAEQGTDILQVLDDPFYERMRAVRKPLIAALNGHFTAAGMVLAVNCDLRVGLAGTRAGIAEAKVGRGSPWAVPMLWMAPQAVVMEMVLTGEPVAVERLYQLGFLNALADDDSGVLARARAVACRIRDNAPLSVAAAKCSLMAAPSLGCDAGFAYAKRVHEPVYASADAEEGPRAFVEKRPPRWVGR
ncbi:enoyl-CoA hydratase/isomerase family protein [Bordetella sp. 2513F-2]